MQKLVKGYILPQNNIGEWILTKFHFSKPSLEKLFVFQEENCILLNILTCFQQHHLFKTLCFQTRYVNVGDTDENSITHL